jgi:cell division protein ZapA
LKRNFCINILEQELSVASESGDDHVASVVQYVKEKADWVKGVSGNVSILNVAILTALNIADEYLRFKETNEEACGQMENRAENLISLINGIR